MQAEIPDHLGYPRNAPEGKTDGNSRKGSFEPLIVPKGESRFKGFDDKIISMYARGRTTRDIQSHQEERYGWRFPRL